MPEALLHTKLFVPPLRPRLVQRHQLMERLNKGLGRTSSGFTSKLTLVCAPAGFGKTTAITEWICQLTEYSCAWLSLDDNDNDPTRFLTYVVASLQTIRVGKATGFGGNALALLQSPQTPPIKSILAALINEIASTPHQIVLVLDDYHIIQTQAVHDILTFLLDNLPPQLHMVIATRTDPPLLLARLRIQGHLSEIRLSHLRFTPDETANLFNKLLGLSLSAEDITALDARTEGWIAGLQVAALSMVGLDDVSTFIRDFTGSHRYILDYLVEEVIDRQPDNIQRFLLRTSILDSLTGPLCDEVTGEKEGREVLEELERNNLFIVSLDNERRWYRYHHLFADLLRARLDQILPEEAPVLHRRASVWLEKNGQLTEAVRHGLAAEDYEWSAYLIEKLADALWARGEPTTLLRWLETFPEKNLTPRPHLCINHAWALFINGKNEAAESMLQDAERVLNTQGRVLDEGFTTKPIILSEAERSELSGRIAAIRASIAFRQGDFRGVFRFSEQAFENLSDMSNMWRCVTAIALGYAQDFSGDTRAAFETLTEAVSTAKASDNVYLMLNSGLHLGTILMLQGKLKQAYALGQELMQLAQARGVLHTEMAGCLYDEIGAVLCEWNKLDEAMHHLVQGSKLSRQGYDVGVLGYSYLTLLRALFAQGDMARAQEIIEEMEQMEQDSDIPPWYTSPKEAWKARLWLSQGEVDAAASWVGDRGLSAEGDLAYSSEDEYIVLARILIAQNRPHEAIELLNRLLKLAESGGRTGKVIQILIILSMAYKAENQIQKSLTPLETAFVLAEPEECIRPFLDEGPSMAELLRNMLSRGIKTNFVSRLLAAFASEGQDDHSAKSSLTTFQLVEPLSERELTVLRLLGAGLSNREIAEELYVSINTVKAHAKNIYSKLGVHGRMQAVQRARELSLTD